MAAEVERLHRLQQLPPPPQGADPARAAQLVRREREEVAAESVDVDRTMGRALRGIDDMIAPWSCAHAESRSTGLTVPSALETIRRHDLDLSFRGKAVERFEVEFLAVGQRIIRNSAPVRRAMYCQGTKFE